MSDLRDAFAEHRPELLRLCYRMLGSFADAEDLVQVVLLRGSKARDSWSGDAPVGHWLMRIATNACLDELARRRRRGLPHVDSPAGTASEPLEERTFYRRVDADYRPSSLQVVRFVDGRLVEIVAFIGSAYLGRFGLPERIAP